TRKPSAANGLRCAKVSRPAPSTTYWRTPRATAAARLSSAKRLREAIRNRMARVRGRSISSPNTACGEAPSTGTASGSANTSPRSITWCAARWAAARIAVKLGWVGCTATNLRLADETGRRRPGLCDVVGEAALGLPAERLRAGDVQPSVHPVAGSLGQHLDRPAEHLGHLEHRVGLVGAQAELVAFARLADQLQPVDDVVHVREDSLLRARRDHRQRPSGQSLLAEDFDQRPVGARPLARPIDVVEIGDRVGEAEPVAVIAHQLGVGGLGPGIGALVATQAAVGELGRGAGVDQLDAARAAELQHAEGAGLVEVPDQRRLVEALLDARVFAEME